MQTIKLNGQKGDEIALEYKGSTLIVKLDDDAIVPDFVEVLIRALKLDAYRVANTCVDFYHRGTAPEDPFRARFAQSRLSSLSRLNLRSNRTLIRNPRRKLLKEPLKRALKLSRKPDI